jgi:hypothetical protein
VRCLLSVPATRVVERYVSAWSVRSATNLSLEDAADHPERPVQTREDNARSDDTPLERGD